MRLWLKTLISNRFFQVSAGILITMVIGGLVIQVLETGEITEGDTPFWWAIVTMTTVGYGDYSPSSPQGRLFAIIIMFIGISLVCLYLPLQYLQYLLFRILGREKDWKN